MSINPTYVENIIKNAIDCEWVAAESFDNVHFTVVVVAKAFEGKSRVAQHQMIMALFHDALAENALHALSIKTYTPEKWAAQQNKG